MLEHVKQVSKYWLMIIACVITSSCAMQAGEEGEGALDEPNVEVESVAQDVTAKPGVGFYTCDEPANGVCLGQFGRVCHKAGRSWCQWWVCDNNGCSWQLPTVP